MKRRKFLNQMGVGAACTVVPQTLISFKTASENKTAKPLKFGIITDVHKDLIPDADERLEKFIKEAVKRKVDFIIQLGDFCFAESKNLGFLGIWNSFKGPKYHVLGNHDMDRNSKPEMLEFLGMPKTYYSYDIGGYHFVVLDANFSIIISDSLSFKSLYQIIQITSISSAQKFDYWNIEQFIIDTYKRFYLRIPSELEKSFFLNYFKSNPTVTPELVFTSFAASDEYLFY